MIPLRPYKCLKDIPDENTGKLYTMMQTINLFDVVRWCECSNDLEGIKDNINRTIVSTEMTSFIFRVSYHEFDGIMEQLYKQFDLYDSRSLIKPDRLNYQGFIQAKGSSNKEMLAVTFHRKGYEPTDFNDFAFHAIFSNINPMN